MVKRERKRNRASISGDSKKDEASVGHIQVETPPEECSDWSSLNSGQFQNVTTDLQFGSFENSLHSGLQSMMQDPFLSAFTAMTAENSFAPNCSSAGFGSRPISMALSSSWESNILPKMFDMPGIPPSLLDHATLSSVTPNGLLLASPCNSQNPRGIHLPTSWDATELVNNLLPMWPAGQQFNSRCEFERAMESTATFGILSKEQANQISTLGVTPAVTTKSDYTVVNDGFYSTTLEDETARTSQEENDVDSDDDMDVSEVDSNPGSDDDAGADEHRPKSRRRSSRRKSSRSQTQKKKGCENGKCSLNSDGRRRNRKRQSRSTSRRNRRAKSAKQSGSRRRVSRRSKSVQSRRRRSSRKSSGKRRSRR